MLTTDRFRCTQRFALLAATCLIFAGSGCGGGNQGTTVKTDEKQEKALTDSMRGYFEKESKKESKKEAKPESSKESAKK